MTSFAFVFPGQGSQAVGMLDAWGDHPAVRDTLAEASAALDQDLAALIHAGPKDQLDLTTNTQPVMLTAAIACYRAWRAEGGAEPAAVAGHSLGEYSALVAAGSLSLADAVPLVRFRAQAMQQAVPVGAGAMAAILGLDPQAVRDGCAQAAAASGEVVEAANFNDPKQTVIAGSKAGVDKACEVLKAAGAKRALPLPVSAPFHCSLMKPAAERAEGQAWPAWPSGHPAHRGGEQHRREGLKPSPTPSAMRCTARPSAPCAGWTWCKALVAGGQRTIVECGPGKVLAGMVKRIDRRRAERRAVRPGHAGRGEGAVGMSVVHERCERPGGPGHRRVARHRPRHRGHAGCGRATRSSAPPPARPAPPAIGDALAPFRRPGPGAERHRRRGVEDVPPSTPSSSSMAACRCW